MRLMTSESPKGGGVRPLFAQAEAGNGADAGGSVAPEVGQVATKAEVQGSVVALRDAGKSYAAIARNLRMPRALDAQLAFVRAVRDTPELERTDLVKREFERLELLEHRIRDDAAQEPDRMRQRLAALEKLRAALK
jgi:hypothetical protein